MDSQNPQDLLAAINALTREVARIADILDHMVVEGLVTLPDTPASDN